MMTRNKASAQSSEQPANVKGFKWLLGTGTHQDIRAIYNNG
jgi:hypothetical protein